MFPKYAVLIGDNNTGKTTILEAMDLALGANRLNRQPIIDEHDFFRGIYTLADASSKANTEDTVPKIVIEVTIADLTEEQKNKFGDYIEFWDSAENRFYDKHTPTGLDALSISESVRVTFHGWYNKEEDDFEGATYFSRSLSETDSLD